MTLAAPAPFEFDLRDLVLVLWRRRYIILGTMGIALATVMLFVLIAPPLYTGRALIMIEPPASPMPTDTRQPAARLDSALVMSEAEVIKSRALALKVIN